MKEGAEGAEPPEEPTIALEQVNQQTLRITMLLMFALFGVMFWAIWSDLITVFSYLDSITLWHYNGTEAGAAVVKNVTMGSLLFAIIASMVAQALIRNLQFAGSAGALATEYAPWRVVCHYYHP